jgi:hypothetical protein
MPVMLDALRIYTDASLPPDQSNMIHCSVCLEIFIIGYRMHHNFNVNIEAFPLPMLPQSLWLRQRPFSCRNNCK